MPGFDGHHAVTCPRLGVSRGLDDDVDRQADDNRQICGGDELAAAPGMARLIKRTANGNISRRDAEGGKTRRRNGDINIDGNPDWEHGERDTTALTPTAQGFYE